MSKMTVKHSRRESMTTEVLRKFSPIKENLLNILHAMQDNEPQNYLSEADLEAVAEYLKIPKSAVMGVATYYSMYSLHPRGKYIIRVCVSPVCQLMKGEEPLNTLQTLLGVHVGQTTPCGNFTLEISECQGHCAASPCMMVNRNVYDNLDAPKIAQILNRLADEVQQ